MSLQELKPLLTNFTFEWWDLLLILAIPVAYVVLLGAAWIDEIKKIKRH